MLQRAGSPGRLVINPIIWKRSPLPDFFIGAHAAIAGYTLLTRDATRYRRYFPKLRIVAP